MAESQAGQVLMCDWLSTQSTKASANQRVTGRSSTFPLKNFNKNDTFRALVLYGGLINIQNLINIALLCNFRVTCFVCIYPCYCYYYQCLPELAAEQFSFRKNVTIVMLQCQQLQALLE